MMVHLQDRPELFLIHPSVIDASSPEEVEATFESMKELGLAHLPYPKVDIGIDAKTFYRFILKIVHKKEKDYAEQLQNLNSANEIRFQFNNEKLCTISLFRNGKIRHLFNSEEEVEKDMHRIPSARNFDTKWLARCIVTKGLFYRELLIVLLATKNVIKTRAENKALRLGIGTKNEFKPLYTTTLTLPRPEHMDTIGPTVPGRSPRPHLRRGHIRHQHYGPRNTLLKQVWIAPVFVNADESFISNRTAYNTNATAP